MKRQSGISLIEVLVAVLVLAIGLLGVAGLQTAAMSNNFTSYQYTQAAFLTESMIERMRANRQGVLSNFYSMTAGTAPTAPSTSCTAPSTICSQTQQATWDMALWYAEVTGSALTGAPTLGTQSSTGTAINALPGNPTVSITCPNPFTDYGACVVTVYWDPGRSGATTYGCGAGTTASTDYSCFRLSYTP